MIETEISIIVNRKSDIDLIEQKIIESRLLSPVYIREYEFSYQINFTSEYEQWELDKAILNAFPGYTFTKDVERGRKEIRLQISRYQSDLCTDGWGRPIEDPLNETKYLVKASTNKPEKFSPKIKVLFQDKEQFYYVNFVNGINKATEEKGFLLVDNFRTDETENGQVLKDKLYKSPFEAFAYGYHKLAGVVNEDFSAYLDNKKKEIREIEKLPRKIIRDFTKACNGSDHHGMLKNLDKDLIFDQRKNWQTVFKTEGLIEFRAYLNSSEQQLCGKDFKIRSSWDISLPSITIGIKYFPKSSDATERPFQKYGRIHFVLENSRIIKITADLHNGPD